MVDMLRPGPVELVPPEVTVLRQMAWERAKGEIRGMLCSYWPTRYRDDEEKAAGLEAAFEQFVQEVEDNGYQE